MLLFNKKKQKYSLLAYQAIIENCRPENNRCCYMFTLSDTKEQQQTLPSFKIFLNMKTEYFKNLINLKEPTREAYASYLDRVVTLFEDLKAHHDINRAIKLQAYLQVAKDHKELKGRDKQPIYKYLVARNTQDFHFLRPNNAVELRLLKLTKTPLEDYTLDWRQLWERLLAQQPEIPSLRLYGDLTDFLKNIRHLYAPDNALAVVDYFIERHSLNSDNICNFISSFTNISSKTPAPVLLAYLQRLLELYHLNHIKASDLLVMYINAAKYKQHLIPPLLHQQLTKILLYSLATPNTDKKDSIESKFSTQTASIVYKFIGNTNKHSLILIKRIFELIQNFIRPFEDSKKPLKFICLLLIGLNKRLETEEAGQQKLVKLRAKEEKRIKTQTQKQAQESATVPPLPTQEDSAITEPDQSQLSKVQQPKKSEEKQEEEQDSESQEEQQNDSDEQQKQNRMEKLTTLQLEIQDLGAEKTSNLQARIDKIQALLQNKITPQIKLAFKQFLEKHLEDIFYVNSKKIVNRLLKQAFKLYPELIPRALVILQKAGSIPQINEEGLISNIKHIAKHIFSPALTHSGDFLEHALRLLARLQNNRRITDVWDIIAILTQKLPLLDEQDMQEIPEKVKEDFQKQYGQNHDTFYENYSEAVFDSLKRLFAQSEHYDTTTSATIDRHLLDLLANSHPHYRKRVIRAMEEEILQNSNKFLITLFHSGLKPSPSFTAGLRAMIENRNIDSEQNLQLQINVNIILSTEMDISTVKGLFRRYSRKNNYKFLKQCLLNLTNYNLVLPPLPSSLAYLTNKPTFTLTQEPPAQFARDKMEHFYNYAMQLIEELNTELAEFEEQSLRALPYNQLVLQIHSSKENTFKNMKVQKRKTVNQLLQILKNIAEHLFHEFEQYNPTTNTLSFTPAPYARESFLNLPRFIKVVDLLVFNELFLHDHHIMQNLTQLLDNEINFMYRHHIRHEKEYFKKYSKKNNKEELPGESNLSHIVNIFIAKARIAHFSLLFNTNKDTVSIDDISKQLRILLIAPGNDKSSTVNKIFVKKTKDLAIEADHIISLLSQPLDSRFYFEKVLGLLSDFMSSGHTLSPEQILALINIHLPLMQSDNIKVREQSVKSLEKFLKTMHKEALIGPVQQKLRQFTKIQKQELIWIVAILIILKEGRRSTPVDTYLIHLRAYLAQLQTLMLSPTRILRRLALFAYAFCLRRAHQTVKHYETLTCSEQTYSRPKTFPQLFETGYLRDEHIGLQDLAKVQVLKRLAPYSTYHLKKKQEVELYNQIENQSFAFLLEHHEAGLALVKQFHLDMAASVEEVLAMTLNPNKKHDLAEIAVRSLEGCYVLIKIAKLHYSRFQNNFGERFFRYLFFRDAQKHQLSFFLASRSVLEPLLSNLQAYDNQTLLFISLTTLLHTYHQHGPQLPAEAKTAVEQYVLKVVTEVLYKGSGVVFKKLNALLSKDKHKQSHAFLIDHLAALIANKEKVSRASLLLLTLREDNYPQFTATAEFALKEKQQLNHPYLNTIINSIISLPDKFTLTAQQAKRYGIVHLQTEIKQKRAQKVESIDAYLLSTAPFNVMLRDSLNSYLTAIRQPSTENAQEALRQKNQLIKATYSLATNAVTAYCQFYETSQAVDSIVQLLQLLFRLFQYKMDLPVDYKQLEQATRNLLANKYDNIVHFSAILDVLASHLHQLPLKKQADLLRIIANRPANFLFLPRNHFLRFLKQLLPYEEHSMIYRETLLSIATLLAYVPLSREEVNSLVADVPKGQAMLLLQSYLLATQDFSSELVERVLSGSGRERRNLFCKEMLQMRGKKEYLDDEERYLQWKQIKQYSNPYHYHA